MVVDHILNGIIFNSSAENMTLTDHHWSSHPTPPPSSATPPMIMDHHHHHHQQQSSLDSCSSSPGQTSLTSSHSSTSYAMTDMTNHSSCSSESFLNSMSFLERKPYRPFRSNEEYLIAMKEDLAEWLNTLYSLDLNCENFLQRLETGVILCQHANSVLRKAREWRLLNSATGSNSVSTSGYVSSSQSFNSSCSLINAGGDNSIISIGWNTGNDVSLLDRRELVPVKINALPGTFQARDNVANFIEWCRRIHIHECLLFETEDLVGRKNEKSFVLCLLEVARYGAKFGVLAPTLVQFEQEIDREIENDQQQQQQQQQHQSPKRSQVTSQDCRIRLPTKMISNNSHQEEDPVSYQDDGPQQQITNNDLESLHEKVVNLLSRCTCPVQFYLEHLSEGKYRIGDTRTLIFVRILRNHVMVRVGGGWDTLEHYLEKHDPCRGRFGHRFSNSARASLNSQGSAVVATNHHQNYHRASVGSSNVQVASDRPDHQQQHSSNSVYRSTTTVNQLSPLTSRRSMTQNLASTTRIPQQSSPQDSLVNGNNSGVSSVRRASTSSNDSHHSFSSSSSTSLLPSGSSMELYTNANSNRTPTPSHSHCHSMTNFVLPDRNNNIKGLATSSNNGSVQNNGAGSNRISSLSSNNNNKPQVAINKKRINENFVSSSCSLNNTNTSCIPSTPTSRIPKSKVPTTPNHLRPSGGSVSPGRKSSTPLLLTQAHKLKSTSICSLTANGSGNGSRIPTSASSPLSIDHRKLLTNYGLTPARYSSHNIYSACSNNNQQLSGTKAHHHHQQQQQQQQHQSSKSTSSSASPARIQRNRYDKQKLNKSTIDLMSTGRLNESNHSDSFYSKIQMPNSNGHCSLVVNHDNKNSKSSKLYQPHNNRRPSSSSSSSSGSLPRTKSTTIIANTPTINGNLASISSHFIKKSMINGGVQSKIGSSSNAENNKKRLQGSATSLNSAGSTEGGTTTGSSNGSLNESSMGVGHRRLSSPSPTNLVTIGGGGGGATATAAAAGAGAKTMPNDRKEEPTNTNTKPPTPLIVGRGHSNTDNKADLVVRATMMGGPIVKPTVKPMVEVCSWLERRQNVLD